MGRRFWKMSGSGNDFVVIDSRATEKEPLERPDAIQTLSARGTGVGADGVVFLAPAALTGAALAMRYYNRDGSRGTFCGNATLCVTRLAHDLGLSPDGVLMLETDAGIVPTRVSAEGPEIELPPPTGLVEAAPLPTVAGETRIGFAVAGVPHVVVLCEEVERVNVAERGAELRRAPWRPEGANVNFVSRRGDGWAMRTYERGVEGETLACGTGAVATAVLLATWKLAGETTKLATRSGRTLGVSLARNDSKSRPTLAGEGRIVFMGELAEWSADLDGARG
jgi:diaminopimelate epimerase